MKKFTKVVLRQSEDKKNKTSDNMNKACNSSNKIYINLWCIFAYKLAKSK